MSADKVETIAPVEEKKVDEPVAIEDEAEETAAVDDDAVVEVPDEKESVESSEAEVENGESDKKENGSSEEEKDKESSESTENGDSGDKVSDSAALKRKSVTVDPDEDTLPAEGATPEKKPKLADSEKNGAEVETA